MKPVNHYILLISLLFFYTPVQAALNVFACEPEWASLVNELAADRAVTYSATTAYQDPHHIEARPSLIAKVRRANLVICSGAELEIGWLPVLLRQAANADVLPGRQGYFEAAAMVERLDIPEVLDRSQGDVHASGNPHVHLDPRRIHTIAKALTTRLIELDSDGEAFYKSRLQDFEQRWQSAMQVWKSRAGSLKGHRAIVHHRDWVYLFDWLGIEIAGALEPKPGLPASAGHLVSLKQMLDKQPVSMIVHTIYQNPRAAKRLSGLTATPMVELPYTVGGGEAADDLFGLFDVTIDKLLKALQ